MRVSKVAVLSLDDVLNADDTVKNEIRLDAMQTKGRHARTVFVSSLHWRARASVFGCWLRWLDIAVLRRRRHT
jgi:hypothetical protein